MVRLPPSPFLEQAQRDLSPWLRRNRSPVGRAECMATPPTHLAWGSCNLPNDLTTNAVPKGNSKLGITEDQYPLNLSGKTMSRTRWTISASWSERSSAVAPLLMEKGGISAERVGAHVHCERVLNLVGDRCIDRGYTPDKVGSTAQPDGKCGQRRYRTIYILAFSISLLPQFTLVR